MKCDGDPISKQESVYMETMMTYESQAMTGKYASQSNFPKLTTIHVIY